MRMTTGWHLPSGMKSLQKYQWMCGRAWTKRNPSRTKRNLTLRDVLSPGLGRALKGEQCLPRAGSFAKLGCGPGRGYPWRERDGEPWHSFPWMALGSLHHLELSGDIQHPPWGSCRTGLPQPWRSWSHTGSAPCSAHQALQELET